MQKEFKNLLSAMDKWVKINKGNVSFIGSFVSFDPKKLKANADDCTLDATMIGYGNKKSAKLSLKALERLVREEKGENINW